MNAYAVLEGGGVKGVALAGCLAEAKRQKVEFVGYGGASVGSIIALLAAVGFNEQDLETLAIQELDLWKLLPDGGTDLRQVCTDLDSIRDRLSRRFGMVRAYPKLRALLKRVGNSLVPHFGLYSGHALRRFVREQLKTKVKEDDDTLEALTFSFLRDAGYPTLKIVASDVWRRQLVVFPLDRSQYGEVVLDAVQASASFPFLLQPMHSRLVDGGLASNLPSFLFAEEYTATRHPTLAFDLINEDDGKPLEGIANYGKALLATALEASDKWLVQRVPGVIHIRVPIPGSINPLDFGINMQIRETLFARGAQAMSSFLAKFEGYQCLKKDGVELQNRLKLMYGPPEVYERVLTAVKSLMEKRASFANVRAAIMLPTGRDTRIVVYALNYSATDADRSLELGLKSGWQARAVGAEGISVADLDEVRKDLSAWEMTPEELGRIPSGRKSAICVAIPGVGPGELPLSKQGRIPYVGVLAVDSETTVHAAGWGTGPDQSVVDELVYWACIIGKIMP